DIRFCQNSEHDQRRDERFPTFAPIWLLLGSRFPTLRTLESGFSPLNASFFDRVLGSDRALYFKSLYALLSPVQNPCQTDVYLIGCSFVIYLEPRDQYRILRAKRCDYASIRLPQPKRKNFPRH